MEAHLAETTERLTDNETTNKLARKPENEECSKAAVVDQNSTQQAQSSSQIDTIQTDTEIMILEEDVNEDASETETPSASNAAAHKKSEMSPKSKLYKNDLIRGLIDRKHQCRWCSLRFYTKRQLKQHETSHANLMLNCPVCDKEFSHKDRLAGHMKCHMEPSLECKVRIHDFWNLQKK